MWRAALIGAVLGAGPAAAEIVAARYGDPTTRYDHGVLGDAVEWGALELTLADGTRRRLVLSERRVFEDTAPRLADLDGDGSAEVIAVESDLAQGARLAVYGADGLIAATPFIGQRHRWLAPVGAADLDGDGRVEIAYVDRPHLARILRVWRLDGGTLREVAALSGLTNHRIGEPTISGGIRDCGSGPVMVLAAPDRGEIVLVRLVGARLAAHSTGLAAGAAGFDRALACGG